MTESITALWCGHCDRLVRWAECRACRCVGPIDMGNGVTKRISGIHIVCDSCAAQVTADDLSALIGASSDQAQT